MSVGVVVPHFGPNRLIDRCLASIPPELPVRVVDANYPNRLFFTAAVNRGLRAGMAETEHTIFWVLNNDTEVEEGAVEAALECFEEEPKAGLVGSKTVYMENPDWIMWGGSGECFPKGVHKQGHVSKGDCGRRTEEKWVTFASVFIKRDVLLEIGLLDETMKHYFSDSDYCLRTRAAGWKCFYEPASTVRHVASAGKSRETSNQGLRDYETFKAKWRSGVLYERLMGGGQ
jgi:GT2 family glycosyltransferase